MKQKDSNTDIIEKSLNNNWLHVFLVASPILAIVSRMIIDNYGIKRSNILIVSLRNTSVELFDQTLLKIIPGKYDRYLEKIFFDSPTGRKISNKIKSFDKNFIVYSGGAWREVNWLLKKRICNGHIYIEEGQGTYMGYKPYSINKINFLDKLKFNWRNRRNPVDGIGFYFRDDVEACIGLDKHSFPGFSDSKKIILNNFFEIKKYYQPKILGLKTIGLTSSASRHPKKEDWIEMLEKLLYYLPNGSIIKPHPSFTSNKKVYSEFQDLFNNLNNKEISLCSSKVILELEMLYEKKHIIGPQSSLSRYTVILGSTYEQIKLF